MLVKYNLTRDFWYCLTVSNFYLSLMQIKHCCNNLALCWRYEDGKMEKKKEKSVKQTNKEHENQTLILSAGF